MKKVSIICTTWLEDTKPYLDACMDSILNLNYPQHLLDVILVGRKSYKPEYPGVETVAPDSDSFGNSEGMNFGASFAEADTDFYLFINDDVILTADSLLNMVRSAADNEVILGPISNCDQSGKYVLAFPGFNQRQLRFEPKELKEVSKALMNAQSLYPPGVIVQSHLFFYCTLIPKSVWNKVGKFDEQFKTGPDDIDYSIRAEKLRIPLGICLDSLVWHFSGVTADKTLTPEMREKNQKAFEDKHGS